MSNLGAVCDSSRKMNGKDLLTREKQELEKRKSEIVKAKPKREAEEQESDKVGRKEG